MIFAKAADAVLNRVLPKAEASAAASCGCYHKTSTCQSGRWVDHYYRKVTDYYGQCTIWTALCYSRRTQEPC